MMEVLNSNLIKTKHHLNKIIEFAERTKPVILPCILKLAAAEGRNF
jgi:hypothetical protein